MDSIHTDPELRIALHSIYVAQFNAMKRYPGAFKKGDATRMLTGLMGSRPWSWRVIGITPAALSLFAEHEYKRVRGLIERGHIADRASTAAAVYITRAKAMDLDEFFEFFLERDRTILMAKSENKARSGGPIPEYIPVPQELQLFPCGTLIGWQHRAREVEFLRGLHQSVLSAHSN